MDVADYKYIDVTMLDDLAVVRFLYKRRHEYSEYDVISQELQAVVDGEGIGGIVLNLDAVEQMPSRLLGIFLGMARQMRLGERPLAACRLRPDVGRVFRLSKAEQLVPVFPTEEEALAAARPS